MSCNKILSAYQHINIQRNAFFGLALIIEFLLFSTLTTLALAQQRPDTRTTVPNEQDTRTLELGKLIERELASGQTHFYQLTLEANQFAQVVVDQRGIDVEITLTMPDGSQIIADSQNGNYGPEPVMWIALMTGVYRLELHAPKGVGRYQISFAALQATTHKEMALAEAFKLYNQSVRIELALRQLPGNQRNYDEAITVGERAREAQERALGVDHPDIALTLYHLARLYLTRATLRSQKTDYPRAELLVRRAIENWEKEWGEEHLGLRRPLNLLADVHKNVGNIAQGELVYDRVHKMCEKLLPDDHLDLASARFNLGELLGRKREYERAEGLLEKALQTFEARGGPKDPSAIGCRAVLANIYTVHDKYSRAETLFQKQLQIVTELLGAGHAEVAGLLNNFAVLYFEKGDLAKAEEYHRRVLRIHEARVPANHLDIALSCENLASVFVEVGDYVQAEPLLERALKIYQQERGADHTDVANARYELGVFYFRKGDYAKAEEAHRLALEIRQRKLRPDHPHIAYSLDNLGVLYAYQGKHALAEQHFNDALKIRRKLETDHPSIAFVLNHLAELYLSQNDFARAEPLFKEAVEIIKRRRGMDNPLTANFLFDLAVLYHKKGDYAHAEQLYRQVLAIREQLLGADHLEVGTSLYNLALLNRAKGDMTQAVELLTRCNEMRERQLSRTLAAGSERQKLAYLNTFEHEANDAVSLHAVYAPTNSQAFNLAFTTLLRRKGRGLEAFTDALALFRLRATELDLGLLNQLASARAQFATVVLRAWSDPNPENANTYTTRIRQHSAEIDKLEAELSARNPELKTEPVTIEVVQSVIPPGAALVEFTRYRPRARLSGDSGPPRYAAYILIHQGQPRWVDLGEAEPIRQAIEKWRTSLGNGDSQNVRQLSRIVDRLVMSRVRPLLGQTRHVLLSPDADLNLIPFAALVDEQGRFLIERYSFTYLTSGRDLLRLQTRLASRGADLIVADPVFGDISGSQPATPNATEWQNCNLNSSFRRLLSGGEQAREVKRLLPEATMLTGEKAIETVLKQASGPRILHIVTHGFFCSGPKPPSIDPLNLISFNQNTAQGLNDWLTQGQNPLLRSGLALAGANLRKSGDDDGLLTAVEAAGLDLRGTKLVVLSACETGLGNVESGEGVYGLRRALVLAGAESQVVSLWRISDEGMTSDLITAYYRALQRRQGRSEALRQAQLKMLKQHPHPYFWAAFLPIGEWANLDGQRVTSVRQLHGKRQ